MARSTQYVGLTQAALEFLVGASPDTPPEPLYGMFDEEVPVGAWSNVGLFARVEERLQVAPWCGGPVLLTHLVGFFYNDPELENPVEFLGWVVDPRTGNGTGGVDRKSGIYWL
jgi:hypothetical protein